MTEEIKKENTEEKKEEKEIEKKAEEKTEEGIQESSDKKEAKEEAKKEVKETEKKEEEPVKVPEKFKKLVEEIEKLNVLDLAELVKILEKKFGVTAQAPVVAAPAGQAGTGEGASQAEEKTIFNVELKEMGDKKIEVIKAVRDITGKGLKDSKDLVDALANGPQTVKEGVKKEEAEEIKKKLEAAGAKVELK